MSKRNRLVSLFAAALGAFAAGEARPSPTWTSIGPDGGSGMTVVTASPSSPSILYAGTQASGVQVSRDGGRTWRPAPGVLPDTDVLTLAVDPRRPNAVFAVTQPALVRSLDTGRSWARCAPVNATAVAVHPRNSAVVYAGGTQGVFLSLTRCASWRRLPGLPAGLEVYSLVVDPFFPTRIYVSADYPDSARDGVYVSSDGGFSWSRRLTERPGALLADPVFPRTLYLANESGFFRSTDGGNGWRSTSSLPLNPTRIAAVPGTPPRVCVIPSSGDAVRCSLDQGRRFEDLDPPGGELVQAIGGGAAGLVVGRSDGTIVRSPDGGARWEASGQGFVSTYVEALAQGPGYLLAGGDGLFHGRNVGDTWSKVRPTSATLAFPVVLDVKAAPSDGRAAYAVGLLTADGSGLWKSANGGRNWEEKATHPGMIHAASLAIDPGNPRTLYIGVIAGDGGVWKSTDGGDSWRSLPLVGGFVSVGNIALSPDGSTLYAATHLGIERSRDRGESWQRVLGDTSYQVPLAVAPGDPRLVYTGGFLSRDGGDTWEPSLDPLGVPPHDLAVDPRDPETVYAATQAGVWRKVGARAWERFGGGLINPAVKTVAFDREDPDRLLCGTAGSGAYELILE